MKAKELIAHIEKANVGGLINEIVFGDKFVFSSTDEAKNVIVTNTVGICDSKLGEFGVYGIDTLLKAIQYVASSIFSQDEDISVELIENRLVFRKGGNEFKFLLADVKLISTTVSNIQVVIEKLSAPEAVSVKLSSQIIGNMLQLFSLINPESITFYSKEGRLYCSVGKEIEHNSIVELGTVSQLVVVSKFKTDVLVKVFSAVSSDDEVVLEIRNNFPMVIKSGNYILSAVSL